MKISDILDGKGRSVHSVPPWRTVGEVAAEMARLRIGALLVRSSGGAIEGIVSERDIVAAVGNRGAAVLTVPVEQVMTKPVRTCSSDETVAHAMAAMTVGRHRHLPVVDGGELVGMVSIGDLVKNRVREMELEAGVLRDAVIARY